MLGFLRFGICIHVSIKITLSIWPDLFVTGSSLFSIRIFTWFFFRPELMVASPSITVLEASFSESFIKIYHLLWSIMGRIPIFYTFKQVFKTSCTRFNSTCKWRGFIFCKRNLLKGKQLPVFMKFPNSLFNHQFSKIIKISFWQNYDTFYLIWFY